MAGTLGSSLPKLNPLTMMYRFDGDDREFPAESYEQVARQRLDDAIARLAEILSIAQPEDAA